MDSQRKRFAYAEIRSARKLSELGDLDTAFAHLERAHVAGQPYVVPHTLSHWYMLKIGLKRRSIREVRGQLVRIPFGVVGSAIGVVPTGNTGGANISMFQRLPIDAETENGWSASPAKDHIVSIAGVLELNRKD